MAEFTPEVYAAIREGAQRSAAAVVPAVYKIVEPRSVVDVGGGEGWWAREFLTQGVEMATVTDSTSERFEADRLSFLPLDLTDTRLLETFRQIGAEHRRVGLGYDLAVCLEVAEHLPETAAAGLVAALCELAPVVLFSAAIPGQRGLGHVNEQWPGYWARLFATHGLLAGEGLRSEFWDDDRVEPWYRQNVLLFAEPGWFAQRGMSWTAEPRSLVHPDLWAARVADLDELKARAEEVCASGVISREEFFRL